MQIRKYISFILLTALLLSTWATPLVLAAKGEMAKVKVDVLNVRSGPGLDYKIVTKIHIDQQFEVIEEKNSWVKLKTDQTEGWVASWFIDKINSSNSISVKTVEASTTNLNIRSGPSTSFSTLDQIHPGTKYPIIEIEGDWIKIQLSPSKTGWVAKWLVNILEDAASDAPLQKEMLTINADRLNVRSGPSTGNEIIGKLNTGDKVEVFEIKQAWYKIKYDGEFGWIASQFASKGNSANNSNQTEQGRNVIVQPDILNLRSGPSLQHKIIAKLKKNDVLIVHDSKSNWLNVAKSTDTSINGWVADWLVVNSNQTISNQPTVTILNPGTNLREGPSTSYKVINLGNVGDQFPILAIEGDWYKIQLPNGDQAFVAGWIVVAKGIKQNITHGIEMLLSNKVIVVDAGHGGRDYGAVGNNFKSIEKSLNFTIAEKLQKKLEATGAKVIMTRTNNLKIPLQKRVDISILNKADAFISIHHNTNSNTSINGTITYYYSKKDKNLAQFVQAELIKRIGLKDLNVRYGSYFVLRENPQLSVLVELAFISNFQDELIARSDKFQENAAEGMFQGVIKYFDKK